MASFLAPSLNNEFGQGMAGPCLRGGDFEAQKGRQGHVFVLGRQFNFSDDEAGQRPFELVNLPEVTVFSAP